MSTEKRYPSDFAEKFMLRLPPGMRSQIAKAAEEGHRSMNAEMVARLQTSLERYPVWPAVAAGTKEPTGKYESGPGLDKELGELIKLLPLSKKRALLELLAGE